MGIKIDKGVPLPPGTNQRYPFKAMLPGDSFFVTRDDMTSSGASNLRVSARYHFGAGNYTVRKEGSGYRVWRTGSRSALRVVAA